MAVLPPSRVPNGKVPPGVKPFNVKISSLCSLDKKKTNAGNVANRTKATRKYLQQTLTWRSIEPFYQLLVLCCVLLLYAPLEQLKRQRQYGKSINENQSLTIAGHIS